MKSAARLSFVLLAAFPPRLQANPAAGEVVAGAAAISSSGGTLSVVQTSENAVINWGAFSIEQGETTRFIQPSAMSAVLNRVTGGDPSAIYGTLQANGRVFLINPNGVTVGPTGVINAQSFVASTLDLEDGSFMAGGTLLFAGSSAANVVNMGRISALGGDVLLIAHTVRNEGEIAAPEGTAGLAAGSEVLIQPDGDERVFVKAGGTESADVGIDQRGRILAATAELKAAGGNVYSLAINNAGVVQATGVERRGGRVYLVAEGAGIELNTGSGIGASGAFSARAANLDLNDGSVNAAAQTYDAAVNLGADMELDAKGGDVTFNGAVSGGQRLTIDAARININGGSVNTDAQTYNGAVVLGADTILTSSGGDVTFNGAVSGPGALTVNAGSGGINLNGGSVSTGAQTYYGEVRLVSNAALTSSNGNVSFNGGVNGPNALTVHAGAGDITFAAAVGRETPLSSFELAGTGTTRLEGHLVSTVGHQTYGQFLALVQDLTLLSLGGGVTFSAEVSGPHTLSVGSGAGAIHIDGRYVDSWTQRYDGEVRLGADTLLYANGGDVTLNGAVSGGRALMIHAANINLDGGSIDAGERDVTLDGPVRAAGSLTIHAANIRGGAGALTIESADGAIALAGDVSARGLRIFARDILMGGDVSVYGEEGVLLVAGNSFRNTGGGRIATADPGRFLIYSVDPARDALGGLSGSVQWNTSYANGPEPGFAGSGFLYSVEAPPPPPPPSIPSLNFGAVNGYSDPLGGRRGGDLLVSGAGEDDWSASPGDLFSWDLGTLRDAVASPGDSEDPKKKKRK